MTFNPTHEFRGLELEYVCDNSYMHYHSYYRTRDDHQVSLPEQLVTKIVPKPQPGEVWKYIIDDDGSGFLRGVDTLGRLFTLEHQDVVWDPHEHNDSTLQQYEKVLNADGSPA